MLATAASLRTSSGRRLRHVLVIVLFVVLWFAGGASRADVPAQFVVRAAAWLVIIVAILALPKAYRWPKVPTVILLASVLLPALQLVPLPPDIWMGIPGRGLFAGAADVSNQPQPWRPLSVSPSRTVNALAALVVPVAVLGLAGGISRRGDRALAAMLLCLVAASCIVALVQASGGRFDHPLINDIAGHASGLFANRNHFALFAAIGCVLGPAWSLTDDGSISGRKDWRAILGIGLVLLFLMLLLATGSRSGLLLGVVAITLGTAIVRVPLRQRLSRVSRRTALLVVSLALGVLVLGLIATVWLGRAASLDRALVTDAFADLRFQALPIVFDLIRTYFPVGAGFGTFDAVYRIAEPADLLQPSYLNHAHNDWMEIVLDGGLPALLLLIAALSWYVRASWRAWRSADADMVWPRSGSAVILLVMLASVTDYPARTPMIMAVLMLAAIWLSRVDRDGAKLPSDLDRDR